MLASWFAPQAAPVTPRVRGERWSRALLPVDGSELGMRALDGMRPLLDRAGLSLALLRVVPCEAARANDRLYQLDARHRPAWDSLADARSRIGADAPADLRFGDPATEILRAIAEGGHDVVLMSAGRSAALGSVARRVLRSSPAPLLLFRPRWGEDGTPLPPPAAAPSFARILVLLDGGPDAEEIVPAAERMARTLGSELRFFRAVAPGAEDEGGRYLEGWAKEVASRGVASSVRVRTGGAAERALELIREDGIGAVALGSRARGGLARALRGDVARELLRGAGVPLLLRCASRRRRPPPAPALEHRRVWLP